MEFIKAIAIGAVLGLTGVACVLVLGYLGFLAGIVYIF